MALYIPYIVGSVSFAYVSSFVYSSMFNDVDQENIIDNIEKNDTENEIKNNIIITESNEIAPKLPREILYRCSICNRDIPIDMFSKNQQKKLKSLWKCKPCAKKLD